jgi:phospholipase C
MPMDRQYLAFGLSAILAACSGGAAPPSSTGVLPAVPAAGPVTLSSMSVGSYIKHVVIVVQENRSFDNLFATFPGADGATSGKTSTGKTIPLQEGDLTYDHYLTNSHAAFVTEYHGGKMNGWNLVEVSGCSDSTCAYQYVNPAQIQPYWTLAKKYVLADHMFPTESSGSFTGHQDLIRGDTAINKSESLIDFPSASPWGCDAPSGTTTPLITKAGQYIEDGPFPCLTYATLRDLLDAKKVTWKYYAPPELTSFYPGLYWNAFDAIKAVREGPEWQTNVSMPETNIFSDIKKGHLAGVSWVIPDGANSDHAGFTTDDTGPSWVAQVVNAIGRSRYWKTSAIVILWDDWGGWYDHVPPPQLTYAGLGFRVPAIIVSPYAKQGYISHTRYQFGSVVSFVERVFALGSLRTTDKSSASLEDVFDFTQTPRKFKRIPAKYSQAFFEQRPPSNIPVDTN